jgi:serine/threonine-protein kinase
LPSAYPQPGDIIDGKYEVLELLGEGGMGAVAKARHLIRRVPVALKFIAPHVMAMPGALERFLNEAAVASQIGTDHVAGALDVGRLPSGAPYLVLEYLEGRELSAVIEEHPQGVEVPRAIHFVLQILRALQVAHDAGVIHRDLKPANCFVVHKEGDPDFLKVLDFGISKLKAPGKPSITQTGSALGTPLYMSPEQARSPKDVDGRSDIWSAGAILYELLSGRTPYLSESGEVTEIIIKLFTQEPTPLRELRPELDPRLVEVVHKALAHEREGRFASAREMAEALAPFADARSAQVLSRIRSHRPGELVEGVTGLDAFVQLSGGARAPAQSDAPPPIPAVPPPARAPQLGSPSDEHVSIRPPSEALGVSPVARTALSVGPPPAPAATQDQPARTRGKAPIVVALGLVGAAIVGAVVISMRAPTEPAKPEPTLSASPPAPTTLFVAPTITAPSSAPSAAPSAAPPAPVAPSATPPRPPPSARPAPSTSSTAASTGATTPRPGLSGMRPMD